MRRLISSGRFASANTPDIPISPRERFESFFVRGESDKCWQWLSAKLDNGYGVMWLHRRNKSAHRYSYELYVGPIPEGLCVLHKCDNRECVNPNHLFLGTRHDNILDAKQKGRLHTGSNHHASKLTAEKVKDARLRHESGVSLSELSRVCGVHRKTLQSAIRGETWRHV